MYEYKLILISFDAEDTENHLNVLASKGWRVVCSYARKTRWLILEREKEK